MFYKIKIRNYLILTLSFTLIGAIIIILSKASTASLSVEPDSIRPIGSAYIINDTGSSNGSHIKFKPNIAFGNASPGGTYADWYYPGTGLESIEWTEVPLKDPNISLTTEGLLHYYAYTFSLNNSTNAVGFGYTGFQTNGYINGIQRGKVINFSIWGSNGGNTSSIGIINSNNQESGGFQIMYPYNWIINHKYRFQIKAGPSGIDSLGKWWGLYVTDLNTNQTTFIAEERAQISINGLDSSLISPHTGSFGEDLHWWRSLSGSVKYSCSDFDNSSMATINVTANNGVLKPTSLNAYTNSYASSTDPNNGYNTTNCLVSVYTDSNKNLQMNLGYWNPSASNSLN